MSPTIVDIEFVEEDVTNVSYCRNFYSSKGLSELFPSEKMAVLEGGYSRSFFHTLIN